MSEVKAVVFDVDGTLLNTFEHIVRAFEVVLPQHGQDTDREAIRRVIGKTLIDCYRALVPVGDHEAMRKTHHEVQQTPEMYNLIVTYDGLREELEALADRGIAVAVQTNRSRESIDLLFNHTGIADLFEQIVTPEDVKEAKPNPEGLLLLANRLGIEPHNMVMVGDTDIDISAGKNAGVAATIGLTHGFGTRAELEAAGATYIIDSFTELPGVIDQHTK